MQKIYVNEEKDLNKTDVSRTGNTIESERNENNKSQTKKVKIKKIVKPMNQIQKTINKNKKFEKYLKE